MEMTLVKTKAIAIVTFRQPAYRVKVVDDALAT
jgi:hypothetical protein